MALRHRSTHKLQVYNFITAGKSLLLRVSFSPKFSEDVHPTIEIVGFPSLVAELGNASVT
jgi:hypothetical protein